MARVLRERDVAESRSAHRRRTRCSRNRMVDGDRRAKGVGQRESFRGLQGWYGQDRAPCTGHHRQWCAIQESQELGSVSIAP
eukprot:1095860-Prorocentrum_minimum.AAC.1